MIKKISFQTFIKFSKALFALTDSLGRLTNSEEIFFQVPKGEMKLRLAHPGKDIGELISSRKCPLEIINGGKTSITPDFYETRTSPVAEAGQLRVFQRKTQKSKEHLLLNYCYCIFSIL
jgi:hypothetical protein